MASKQSLNHKKPYNTIQNLDLTFFGKLIIFRCGSIKEFGKKLGVSRSRACQIAKGIDLPVTTEGIRKIAKILFIDELVLSMFFSQTKNFQEEREK